MIPVVGESHAPPYRRGRRIDIPRERGYTGDVRTLLDAVRRRTEALTAPLTPEDCTVQSMADASPARWHLAHTTWFFETFVLKPHAEGFRPRDPRYEVVFNSYYNGVGEQFPRALRGTLSRPSVAEILAWRAEIDEELAALLERGDPAVERLVRIGLHHEQQHQELIVTDIKHALCTSPLDPVYRDDLAVGERRGDVAPGLECDEGVVELGFEGAGFHFDNERPRHRVLLSPHRLAGELVTNAEWLAFMEDGGYRRHELWLSDGWDCCGCWEAPLYWRRVDGRWHTMTLGGLRPVALHEPVTHVSFFEADAYARWAGARLPTEAEWEHAASQVGAVPDGTFVEDDALHPIGAAAPAHGGLRHLLGEVWEWTSSPYRPYPGYRAPPGAVGEYNGKFMNGLYVLRGGSCATPRDHIRATYRNFFAPDKRWQFSGVRLAWDLT